MAEQSKISEMKDLAEVDILTVLHALSDPVRIDVVRQLASCNSDLACGELHLKVAKSTTTHHLKILRAAGILASRDEGTRSYLWLRKEELDQRFPGLIDAVLNAE